MTTYKYEYDPFIGASGAYEITSNDGDFFGHVYTESGAKALCDRLNQHAADSSRLEWFLGTFFVPKWNGVLGVGSETTWTIAGDWRHTCVNMKGPDFRDAVDYAKGDT